MSPNGVVVAFFGIDVGIMVLLALLTVVLGSGTNPLRMWRWTFTAGIVCVLAFLVAAFADLPRPAVWVVAVIMVFGTLGGFIADALRLQRERAPR
jgi:hypothetical protein